MICFRLILASLVGAISLVSCCALNGCDDGPGFPIAQLDPTEVYPGGETTNQLLMGVNAFISPAPNLSPEHKLMFYSGNSWFNQSWVEAPASADTRDGLGPFFNATSCSGCHFKDGRGKALTGNEREPLGVLFRLSIPGLSEEGFVTPEPVYGDQLQPFAILHVPPEARMKVQWEEVEGSYGDGTSYSLRKPTYELEELAYGPVHSDVLISPRVAPTVIGMGLLEAISEEDILAAVDEDDTNNDGISGRVNRVWSVASGAKATGRFGWKAEQPTVREQVAAAFSGDVGITTSLFPERSCTQAQAECLEANSGGEPELPDNILDRIEVYTQGLAVPIRRNWNADNVLRGKLIFSELGCDSCHTPKYVTGTQSPLPELREQTIWPYTDLLLHDMGEGLSDNRPVFDASGAEWRTPPLWGLGLIPSVNKHDNLLHDGRARGFAEAILWHGGEGEAAKEGFRLLEKEKREALVSFLESL